MINFDAIWTSTKLSRCSLAARADYVWLYGLADCNGVFEMESLRVIQYKVSPIREDLTEQRLANDFAEYGEHGLAFYFNQNGKRYGYWTNADKPGRLPSRSMRAKKHFYSLGVNPPQQAVESFLEAIAAKYQQPDVATTEQQGCDSSPTTSRQCPDGVWKGMGRGRVTDVGMVDTRQQQPAACSSVGVCVCSAVIPTEPSKLTTELPLLISDSKINPAELADFWNINCGELAGVRLPLTKKRSRLLATLMHSPHFSFGNFRLVVTRARTAPFLCGKGKNGWRANFDWVCEPNNFLRVLEGQFDEHQTTCSDTVGQMVDKLQNRNQGML